MSEVLQPIKNGNTTPKLSPYLLRKIREINADTELLGDNPVQKYEIPQDVQDAWNEEAVKFKINLSATADQVQ